jgi:hypothetical protein
LHNFFPIIKSGSFFKSGKSQDIKAVQAQGMVEKLKLTFTKALISPARLTRNSIPHPKPSQTPYSLMWKQPKKFPECSIFTGRNSSSEE